MQRVNSPHGWDGFLLFASAYYLQLISLKFTPAMRWQEAKKVNSNLSPS